MQMCIMLPTVFMFFFVLHFHFGCGEYSEHGFAEPGEYLEDVSDDEVRDLERLLSFQ